MLSKSKVIDILQKIVKFFSHGQTRTFTD